MEQLSHLYTTTGLRTFVGKVMSLLFSMLSRFVIAFLSKGNRLLVSWLQSPSAVILEPISGRGTLVNPGIFECYKGHMAKRGTMCEVTRC